MLRRLIRIVASVLVLSAAPAFAQNAIEGVLVEGGAFVMGSSNGDRDERPTHRVRLDSFWISKTEVTQKLYKSVMGKNPSRFKGERLPVENVTWLDAVAFCNALSEAQGLTLAYVPDGSSYRWNSKANGYRLPTEAEWEYAARGGRLSQGFIYSGSNRLDDVAWHLNNSHGRTHPVAFKAPNELGLYDMSGNVWEWCWDWYGPFSGTEDINPSGASSGVYRAGKGGAWRLGEWSMRSSNRVELGTPGYKNSIVGLRLVRSLSS